VDLSRVSGSLVDRCPPDDSLSECSCDTLSMLRSNNIVDLDDESSVSLPVNFVCQVIPPIHVESLDRYHYPVYYPVCTDVNVTV